jgi:hypothetical protein
MFWKLPGRRAGLIPLGKTRGRQQLRGHRARCFPAGGGQFEREHGALSGAVTVDGGGPAHFPHVSFRRRATG